MLEATIPSRLSRRPDEIIRARRIGRGSTGVDLNAIPVSAIERIEILRDSARRMSTSKGTFSSGCGSASPAAPSRLTDAEVSYRVAKTLTLAAGAQDLFNVFPDRNTTVNSFNGIRTFPSQPPFGMNGRTVYGRIAWKR